MSERVRIGVVEDEAVVAMDIQAQLERLGYDVVGCARTARQGVTQARTERPDLVLMDIQLSGERDGISAAEEIRNRLGIPVVFLTAYADEASLGRAKAVSPYGYIVKPFDERDLKTSIEIALSRARAQASLERSHADLMAVLDVVRQGTLAVDARGCVTFMSRVAASMIGTTRDEALGRAWEEVLPLTNSIAESVGKMQNRPATGRLKIPARLETSNGPVTVEIEVVDDPRSDGRFIFFLYDVSEMEQLRSLLDRDAAFEKIIGTGKAMQAARRPCANASTPRGSASSPGTPCASASRPWCR
ncbi:MAG: response regulator [Nitrospirae bacterium]|nr:response regulator [Nitrospirota bacterium]